MDSENGNKYFGDIDSIFLDYVFWRDFKFYPQEKLKIKIQNIVSGIIPFFYFGGY